MKKKLQDQFDNGDINHFTYYDYLLQCIENGQTTSFKSTLKELENKELLTFLPLAGELRWTNLVGAEILERMK